MAVARPLVPLLLLLAWLGLTITSPTPRAAVLAEDARPLSGVPVLATAEVPGSVEDLRERIAAVLQRERVPGVGIALVDREGIVWAGGVGVADRDTETPVTADTVFRVASITKSIVGLGVVRLAAQDRLSLDEPLATLLPSLAIDNRWPDAPITLAHALEHTAGLDDMRFNEWFSDDERLPPAAALAINPRSRHARWRPGSRVSYSNVGYTIAGLAIERVTGESFDAWLGAEILRPLGMGEATFARTPERVARLATGYLEPERVAGFDPIAHRPAGALLATPTELGRLVHFWLRRGEGYPAIVPAAGLDRIERTTTLDTPPTDAGYGLGNYGDVAHPVRGRGHDGGLPGFLSSYRYFPELGVGYVMLLNATHSMVAYAEIRALLFAHLTRDRVLPPPDRVQPDPRRAAAAGYYAFANPRNELFGFLERVTLGWDVDASPEGIVLRPPLGPSFEAVPTPDGAYRHPRHGGSSIRLARDREGHDVLVAGWAYAERGSRWLATARRLLLAITLLLLQLAPIAAVVWAVARVVRRRGFAGAGLWLWPAVAGLMFQAIPWLIGEAAARGALGRIDATTVGLCAVTIGFALASAFGLAAAARAALARDRRSWTVRVLPSLTSTLAVGLTLWLGAHGIIGLRTWAW